MLAHRRSKRGDRCASRDIPTRRIKTKKNLATSRKVTDNRERHRRRASHYATTRTQLHAATTSHLSRPDRFPFRFPYFGLSGDGTAYARTDLGTERCSARCKANTRVEVLGRTRGIRYPRKDVRRLVARSHDSSQTSNK